MKPTDDWVKDWRYGINLELERKVSEELLDVFTGFWIWADVEAKSKSTKQRYSGALHALGGYLIEEVGNKANTPSTVREFLAQYIDSGEGPLIYQHNEVWQNERDTVCRKLYRYLTNKC